MKRAITTAKLSVISLILISCISTLYIWESNLGGIITESKQRHVSITPPTLLPPHDLNLTDTSMSYHQLVELQGQLTFVAYPSDIDQDAPLKVVIYSHGSNTTITNNLESPFMQDMVAYGHAFTSEGYIFTASAQHGENWGNSLSIQDMSNQLEYILNKYDISKEDIEDYQVYLLGFSMGALPTTNYAKLYPKRIEKIALLAPTFYVYKWKQSQIDLIRDIPIHIWHGTDDVNIPIEISDHFVRNAKYYGHIDIDISKISGASHFDVDAEYMHAVLDYFNNNEL